MNTRTKIGWVICNVAGYIDVNGCFKCSRYNHRLVDCRGGETCPLCTGRQTMGITFSRDELKCINYMIYNKYNPSKNICTNYSSLDKNCPSLQALLTKYKQNTDYYYGYGQ
jgi:hypothetical protein